jgi:hypothetical protein
VIQIKVAGLFAHTMVQHMAFASRAAETHALKVIIEVS